MLGLGPGHLLRLGGPEALAESKVPSQPFSGMLGAQQKPAFPRVRSRSPHGCCHLRGFAALSIPSHQVAECVGGDAVRCGCTLCSWIPPGSWLVGFSVGGVTPSTVLRLGPQLPGGGLAVAGASPFLVLPPSPCRQRGGPDECLRGEPL